MAAKERRDLRPRKSAAAEHKFQRLAFKEFGAEGAEVVAEPLDAAYAGIEAGRVVVRKVGVAEIE